MEMSVDLSKEEKNKILTEIKKKKIFLSISDEYVYNVIDLVLSKRFSLVKKLKSKKSFEKAKEFKIIVKEIRAYLHDVYGLFIFNKSKINQLFNEIKLNEEWHLKALSCSKSTNERIEKINYYPLIYKQIFSITGKPKIISDLGCGLNPISIYFSGLKSVVYYGIELTKDYCDIVNNYFKKIGIEGECIVGDLLQLSQTFESDVCFLFKVLDSLEILKLNYTKYLLEKINSRFIVVSFATASVKSKTKFKRGRWFIRILNELELKYESFEIGNEIFYIIKKFK